MKTLFLGSAAVVAVFAAGVAIAQPAPVAQTQPPQVAKTQTRADVSARIAQMFARLDTNHDGAIVKEEVEAARAQFAGAPRGPDKGKGMHGGFVGRIIDMADTNKDGRVTLAEAQQAALQHFDRADLNHDGILTPEERSQSRQQMRAAQPRS